MMAHKIVRGYPHIKLGRSYQAKIHSLVLAAFVGPRPEGRVCRHLDGNPINNHVSNLAWGTAEENYDDRRRHGTDVAGSSHGRAKLTEKDVLKIWKRLRSGAKHKVIAEEFGVSRSTVARISCGRGWAHVPSSH